MPGQFEFDPDQNPEPFETGAFEAGQERGDAAAAVLGEDLGSVERDDGTRDNLLTNGPTQRDDHMHLEDGKQPDRDDSEDPAAEAVGDKQTAETDAEAFARLVGAELLPAALSEDDIHHGLDPLETLATPDTAKVSIVQRYNKLPDQFKPDDSGFQSKISTDQTSTLSINVHSDSRVVDLRVVTNGLYRGIPLGYRDYGTGEYTFYPEIITPSDLSTLSDEFDQAQAAFEANGTHFSEPEVDVTHPEVLALCREQYLALKSTDLAESIHNRDYQGKQNTHHYNLFDDTTSYHLQLAPKYYGDNLSVPNARVMLQIIGARSNHSPYRESFTIPIASMIGADPTGGYAPNENLVSQEMYDKILAPLVAKMLQAEQDIPGYDPQRQLVVKQRGKPTQTPMIYRK